MRPTIMTAGSMLLLAGCIPHVDDPQGYAPPPRARYASPDHADATAREIDRPYDRRHAPPPPPRDGATTQRDAAGVASLPSPRPAWEARPVTADAQTVAAQTYTVQPGDTLRRIADRTGAAVEAIARSNAIDPPFAVRAGQQLTIPGGRYHLVKSGESGIAIARAYGVEWSRIVAANDLAEPYVLRAGQRIVIPEPPSGTTKLADRAAAFTLDIDDIITGGEPALAQHAQPSRPAPTAARMLPSTAAVAAPPTQLTGGFIWPVDGRIVERFGPGRTGERSNGIQIAVPIATPIRATADGTVAYAGDGIAALGGLVIVKHGGGWTSVYGHASKLLVRRGQSVKRGQTIALSGDTGFADRPELHFELRKGRTPVDPEAALPKRS